MNQLYDGPTKIDKQEFIRIIESGVIVLICDAIIRAAHYIYDYDWLLKQYSQLLKNPDVEIRGATVTSIGHLARLNEKANKAQLLKILQPLLSNHDIVGRVEDAVDDVNTFL